jgi:glucosamine--fructose-6-phosphate aminotransferase (isomerizing)
MNQCSSHTYREIMSQPQCWHEALQRFEAAKEELAPLWQREHIERVIFTGCGSTYYLSLMGARLFQRLTAVPAQAYPASELVLFPDSAYLKAQRTLLVAVSRSGSTTETVEALKLFKKLNLGPTLTIGCYRESPLAKQADFALIVDSARESSVAQTRSFSSMAVLAQCLAHYLSPQRSLEQLLSLPGACQRLLATYQGLAQALAEDTTIQRFFFLGTDALYGLACEAMLKLKEMSLSYSEAFHTLEFRHGPMSMVDPSALVIGLLSDSALPHEQAVLKQMRLQGARTLSISEDGLAEAQYHLALNSGIPETARAILYLPVLQLLAYYRAVINGQNPDQPVNLKAVVTLDSLMR